MNENNVNQTPNTENGYPQSSYPGPGTEYPNSSAPYPNSAAPYPNSSTPYPNSSTPYPNSAAPYPSSGMSYPTSEYHEKKKSGGLKIAVIGIVAILIVALATILIIIMNKGETMPPPPNDMMMGAQPPFTMVYISDNGVTLNNQPVEIDYFVDDGKTYLNLEDFAAVVGYDFVLEDDKVKYLSEKELATLEIGSTKVIWQDQVSKETNYLDILKAPVSKDGNVYIYVRDLAVFMKNTSVSYNPTMRAVEIKIDNGMQPPQGGMGMPPQGGMQPPPGGAVPAQPQTAAPEQSTQAQPPQEAPGGQMPPSPPMN